MPARSWSWPNGARPGRIGVFDRFLRHATARADVWIATRREIAAHFASKVAPPQS